MSRLIRVRSVEVLGGFEVRLGFTDGTQRVIDLTPFLHGPIFEPIRADPNMFAAVSVDKRMGTIVWPNGADIDPDVLYYGRTPAWMEEEYTRDELDPVWHHSAALAVGG
ncbi:MAG: DUF2442 domain-containing protein [Anaerolineae bacterium]